MCTHVTPAVPYLLLGLHDVQWAVGNSRGARKLARTPHVNQKKKNIYIYIYSSCFSLHKFVQFACFACNSLLLEQEINHKNIAVRSLKSKHQIEIRRKRSVLDEQIR